MQGIVSHRTVNGVHKLALRFPAGLLKGGGTFLNSAMREDGWLVSGGRSVPWRFESMDHGDDGSFLIGPDAIKADIAASRLDDPKGIEEGLSRILVLARALSLLSAGGELPRGAVSSGILVSPEDDVLILPPEATARALAACDPETKAAAVARFTSPRAATPEADASFLLALATYRLVTGKDAFSAAEGESSGTSLAYRVSAPLALAAPRLDPALALAVEKALADPGSVSPDDWVKHLESARERGWTRELTPDKEAEFSARRDAFEAKARAGRKRADFLRKRGAALAVAAAAILALALVAGNVAIAKKDKPDFSAMTPRELVQRYYRAINEMDGDSLEACAEKRAVRSDLNSALTLFVVTRTRIAYEGKNPVLPASDWIAAGKPPLAPAELLYGVSDLAISGEADEVRASYRAEYSFWSTDRPADAGPEAESVPAEERRIDTITLERGEKGWKIIGLVREIRP